MKIFPRYRKCELTAFGRKTTAAARALFFTICVGMPVQARNEFPSRFSFLSRPTELGLTSRSRGGARSNVLNAWLQENRASVLLSEARSCGDLGVMTMAEADMVIPVAPIAHDRDMKRAWDWDRHGVLTGQICAPAYTENGSTDSCWNNASCLRHCLICVCVYTIKHISNHDQRQIVMQTYVLEHFKH